MPKRSSLSFSEKMQVPYMTWQEQGRLARAYIKLDPSRLGQRLKESPKPGIDHQNNRKTTIKTDAKLESKLKEKCTALNSILATDKLPPKLQEPRPALASASGSAANNLNLQNPFATYVMLKHYELWHGELTPSLKTLKSKLEQSFTDDQRKEAQTELEILPRETSDHWLKEQAALTQFATAWYLNHIVDNEFKTAEENDALNAKDHSWFLAPEKDDAEDFNSDNNIAGELKNTLSDDTKDLYKRDAETSQLIKAVETRLEQLKSLRAVLEKSCNQSLQEEYEMQRGLLLKEISTLKARAKLVDLDPKTSPLIKPLAQAEKKLNDAQNYKSFEVDTSKNLYHWEGDKHKGFKRVPVTKSDGSPLKYNPQHFESYLNEQLAKNSEAFNERIKVIDADGTRRIKFRNPSEKQRFISGFSTYLANKEKESQNHHKNSNNSPATAEQTNPAAKAELLEPSAGADAGNGALTSIALSQ